MEVSRVSTRWHLEIRFFLNNPNASFKVVWDHYAYDDVLVLSYHSSDNEEGFPGDLVVNITFQLTNSNEFKMVFTATTTKPTFVNLTNHSYFNLGGENKGADELYKHIISINADRITEVDKDSIPTGNCFV